MRKNSTQKQRPLAASRAETLGMMACSVICYVAAFYEFAFPDATDAPKGKLRDKAMRREAM